MCMGIRIACLIYVCLVGPDVAVVCLKERAAGASSRLEYCSFAYD
jgi:hypothetical protein